ncbi:MAG: hypothetical protein PHO83_12460 [Geobacteraceae bacterium]|nr:hypothetical protein [Geobacteraceae bacterium]
MIKFLLLLIVASTSFISAQTSFAVEPGTTDTVFNKRLIAKIKPMLTYGQVVALAGAPGVKIGQSAKTKPATVQYRWNGGKRSVLTARFSNNQLVEAIVLVPNGRTFALGKDGTTKDLGYQK